MLPLRHLATPLTLLLADVFGNIRETCLYCSRISMAIRFKKDQNKIRSVNLY